MSAGRDLGDPTGGPRSPGRRAEDDPPRVYWLDKSTLAIDWYGHVTAHKCEQALREAEALVRQRTPSRFFSDTSGASGYDAAIRRPAAGILALVRQCGVTELIAVFQSPTIRMFAAALVFVTGLRLHAFGGRTEAMTYIRSVTEG